MNKEFSLNVEDVTPFCWQCERFHKPEYNLQFHGGDFEYVGDRIVYAPRMMKTTAFHSSLVKFKAPRREVNPELTGFYTPTPKKLKF